MADAPPHLTRRSLEPVRRWPLPSACAGLLLASLLLVAAPGLDIAVSRLFYDPIAGFGEERSGLLLLVRELGTSAEWALALAVTAPLLVKFLAPESRLLVRPRATLFALATLALGPGLIVNGILKDFWGRARPREIFQFGGELVFSPAWQISDQCPRNCSFASGEAAAAFWLVALAFLVPKAWRLPTAVATLAAATTVSFARVAAGGHFLSDVMAAWGLTLLVIIAMQKLVLQGLPPAFDGALEAAIGRAGRALRLRLATPGRPPAA